MTLKTCCIVILGFTMDFHRKTGALVSMTLFSRKRKELIGYLELLYGLFQVNAGDRKGMQKSGVVWRG